MIPVNLKLRNFMTYREASLSFEGIHLAALTGENGAGKSSLLDAMTWAVWGQARAKRDDELIRLGQSEMEVEFTFILNDNTYRLVRKRDASKRGRSDLSLQVADSGGWRTLTESSVRATEKKIGQLMRLNYNTFINSAFLLQGRADEFTTQTPAERKRILSDILGLEIYDKYADQAKQIANEKEKEANLIETDIRRIEHELAKEPAYRAELAAAQTEGAALNAALQAAELEMVALRDQHRAVNDKQRQLEDLRDRLTGAAADLADMAEAMQAAQAAIERYQAILARQAEIEAGGQQLAQARTAVQDWEQRLQESAKLSERRHQLERAIQTAQAKIEVDLRAATTKIEMLSPKIAAATSLREQLAAAQIALTELRQWETTQAASREVLAALGEESARLNEQNKQLKLEMDEIKENLTQLEQAGSNCPVCKRPLDETHRTEVLGQFSTEGRVKGDLWRANRERLQEIATEQKNAQRELQAGEKQLQRLPQAQGRVAQLEQSLREAEAAAVELTGVRAEQMALQQRLDNRDFAAEALANLAGVEAELAALGYDKSAHAEARRQAQELSLFEEAGRQLAEAQKRLSEEEKRLAREQARHNRLEEQTAADRARIAGLEVETAGFTELTKRLNQASAAVDDLQRKERFARDRVVMAQQMLSHVAYQAKERGKQEDKLQQIRASLGVYRELQVAFGKKGVQALLIESAIPEIEEEANRLLSRMTDGRMNLRFETQREAKSGDGTIETLDIRIADEVGTRDYELYSGGEAFRINFAIRIAISKILSRRAGARLQTLMIDEGFGTQDAQGRERLVEAINAIQDDFEKLIIITHIDELKDAFPARIEVWKNQNGSQIAIR